MANAEPEISEEEMQAHLDELSLRHIIESDTLAYIVEWLFKHQDRLTDGTTKEQVSKMTQFKQIELLERISNNRFLLGNTEVPLSEIYTFVNEVNKQGFRTAHDF